MSWNNVIPRANLPVSYEGSPLNSPREKNSVMNDWKRIQPSTRRNEGMTNFAAQVMRKINQAPRPVYAYSSYHSFSLYNFPSAMRQFHNDDDWRRVKVRFGFVGSDSADRSTQYSSPAGCDLVPGVPGDWNIDPFDEVFLTTEVPPPDNSSFVAQAPGVGWHEFIVPDDGLIYAFWVSVSLLAFPSEDISLGVLVGLDNTDAYSLQSGVDHLDDVWDTFPQNDPYHFLIGYAIASQGVLNLIQVQFDDIRFSRSGLNTGEQSGSTYTAFRGEYSDAKYYFAGDMVTVTDDTNHVISQYISFPLNVGDGGIYGPAFGPIIGLTPGGANTPDPWYLISRSPTDESIEFSAGAFDATKRYLREI